ncbi:hypothetical protein FRC04_003119 [Tulasnella sp. 424]|nr:hypothetical protein FRC04_003119 [Tulasnella sp. 424]KAG8967514.1 hypothetical protein FRC05_002026 [Tulasnella sp. 425]
MSRRLVAFPSITKGLAHLPNATSMSGVSIHCPLSPSGYSQEAEDKLRRAIASQNQPGREKPDASTATSSAVKFSDDTALEGGDYIIMRERCKSTEFLGTGEVGSADGQDREGRTDERAELKTK